MNLTTTYGKRLREARRDARLTQQQLASRVGLKQATISELENDEYVGSAKTASIASALGVSALWLAEGRGSKLVAGALKTDTLPPNDGAYPRSPSEDDYALVPQLNIAAACGDGSFEDHVEVKGGLAFKRSILKRWGLTEKAARVIYADGESMEPTIQNKCVVLLDTSDLEPREGKVYAIVKPGGGLVLKRLIWDYIPSIGSQGWIMRSDNPDKIAYPDKLLPPDDRTLIVGRAVWNDNLL